MLFRNKSQAFVDDWIKVIEADDNVWDQNAFNELVRKGQQFLPDDPHHYFKGKADTTTTITPPPHTHTNRTYMLTYEDATSGSEETRAVTRAALDRT